MKRVHTWRADQEKSQKRNKRSMHDYRHLFVHLNIFAYNIVPSVAASSHRRFTSFKAWFESSLLQYKGYSITGSVRVVDDIKDHMPFNRPLHCTRFVGVPGRFSHLITIKWIVH